MLITVQILVQSLIVDQFLKLRSNVYIVSF